jgi:EmrB/QacA subfamily drug resistance transporter
MTVALHGDAIQAFWTGTSFLLTSMVWQPIFVAFSRNWGRRPLLLIALAFFAVASLICALSPNFTVMLVGRALQGTGVGGILALTNILITDLVPLRERGNYLALISTVWAVGTVSGPIVGGALATPNAWRWIFYLNLPIIGIGAVGIIWFLKLEHRPRTLRQKLLEIDYIGATIFLAATTSFLVGVTWGGVIAPWDSARVLVPMILGVFGIGLFVGWEVKFDRHPILPLSLFRNKDTNIAFFIDFIHGVILWALVYYMPLFFQGAQDFTPILSGVAALPQSLTVVPCAIAVGVVAGQTGHYRWAISVGWVLATIGTGILYLLKPTTNIAGWVFLMLVSGIGIGLLFPSMALAIQASAPPKDIAIAAAMIPFFRCFGQTIGVAIGGVIFQNRMAANLRKNPLLASSATSYSEDVVALIVRINQLPRDDPTKKLLQDALSNSIGIIWVVMCGLSGIALISTIFLGRYDLNQALVTEQGFHRPRESADAAAGIEGGRPASALPISHGEQHGGALDMGTARLPQESKGRPD